MFGQIAARGSRTPVSLLQTAAFYLFMEMLPVAGERRRPHPSGTEKQRCGQSLMSKKALEERRAPPSRALTSAALIDRHCVEKRKKEKNRVKQRGATWDVKSLWNIVRLSPLGQQR